MKSIVYGLIILMGLIFEIIFESSRGASNKAILAFLGGLIAGIFYYLPSIIATTKKHPNEMAIVVLNAVAGWTFIGWVGSLIWALVKTDKKN
jgi:hypothetical protein